MISFIEGFFVGTDEKAWGVKDIFIFKRVRR
jgi:hypothetical protein